MGRLTRILRQIDDGSDPSNEQLFPEVYDELRGLAAAKIAAERPGHTLDATALVHEAYLRLVGNEGGWRSRRQFFAATAEAMRRILVDHARARRGAQARWRCRQG